MQNFILASRIVSFGILIITILVISFPSQNHARSGGRGKGKELLVPTKPYKLFEAKGLFTTDLKPVFPDTVDCPAISSPFGSKTRYDGSWRKNPHYGYHNGIDISLEIGTPLLSVAEGTVISKGTAGRLVGSYIWLHFKPDAIGLPVHAFVRYQHLDTPSPLAVGKKVYAGEEIGLSGNSGTTGGHFGAKGYPHLHMNVFIGKSSDVRFKGGKIGPKQNLEYFDPLGLYVSRPVDVIDNHVLKKLPYDAKLVKIAVKNSSGKILPSGSRVVWPVICQER